jgi:hypothetical protein
MDSNSKARLNEAITNGLYAKDLMKHEGYLLYVKALEDMILDDKNKWLLGTDEEAKEARLEARGIQKALNLLKKFVIVGNNASKLITQMDSDLDAPTI